MTAREASQGAPAGAADFTAIAWEPWRKEGVEGRAKVFQPGSSVRLRILELAAGSEEHRFCHAGYIGYVLRGRVRLVLPGQAVACGPSDAFVAPVGVPHKLSNEGESTAVLFVVDEPSAKPEEQPLMETKPQEEERDLVVGVNFPNQEWERWEKPGANGRVKVAYCRGKRLRLLELPPGFNEENWCLKGHTGYVLQGEFVIHFTDRKVACKPGMGFLIPDGDPHRSQGSDGEPTLVFVVDEVVPQ